MSSNYHERIMNAQIAKPNISDQVSWSERERLAYKFGHRDARYAAAEIANEADRQLEAAGELLAALQEIARIASRSDVNVQPLQLPIREAAERGMAGWGEVEQGDGGG